MTPLHSKSIGQLVLTSQGEHFSSYTSDGCCRKEETKARRKFNGKLKSLQVSIFISRMLAKKFIDEATFVLHLMLKSDELYLIF